MTITIIKQSVTALPRKLKAKWTIDYQEYDVADSKALEHRSMIRRARQDYFELLRGVAEAYVSEHDFVYYMEQNWGVRITVVPPEQIDNDHEIIDEEKYSLFLLKYAE